MGHFAYVDRCSFSSSTQGLGEQAVLIFERKSPFYLLQNLPVLYNGWIRCFYLWKPVVNQSVNMLFVFGDMSCTLQTCIMCCSLCVPLLFSQQLIKISFRISLEHLCFLLRAEAASDTHAHIYQNRGYY